MWGGRASGRRHREPRDGEQHRRQHDHGLTDEASQRAYTKLLVGWLGEMAFAEDQANAFQSQAAAAASHAVPETPPERVE